MSIGEKIKQVRINKGLTQAQLAEKSGVARVSIGNYERGDRTPPSDILVNIAKALDIHMYDLIDFEGIIKSTDDLLGTIEKGKICNSNLDNIEDLTVSDIKESILSTVIIDMTLAAKSSTIGYSMDNFSEEELKEIADFMYIAYDMKVNEILKRHEEK